MNSNEIIKLLQESRLFQKVNRDILASLLMKTAQVKLVADQILLTPGQMNDHIYVVLSGRLRAQINADDPKPLALFGLSECVGEMSMFDNNHVSAYIIAATDCELLAIPHKDVWTVLNESLQASHNMLIIMSSRIRSSNRVLAENMTNMQGYEALDYINAVTGVYNRHWLSENIGRLIHRHTMNQQPSIFLLLKVDDFGQFDKSFGKLGSDQAQLTIAQTILQCLRPNDVAAHIDTDLFAIFLPQTESENIRIVTDRLHKVIDRTPIVTPSGDALPPATISIGISLPRYDDTLDSLIARTLPAMRGSQH